VKGLAWCSVSSSLVLLTFPSPPPLSTHPRRWIFHLRPPPSPRFLTLSRFSIRSAANDVSRFEMKKTDLDNLLTELDKVSKVIDKQTRKS
jgi:hypothetical protein